MARNYLEAESLITYPEAMIEVNRADASLPDDLTGYERNDALWEVLRTSYGIEKIGFLPVIVKHILTRRRRMIPTGSSGGTNHYMMSGY